MPKNIGLRNIYMKFIFVLRLEMKVKNDDRSKFCNWKEEARKYQGVLHQVLIFSGF